MIWDNIWFGRLDVINEEVEEVVKVVNVYEFIMKLLGGYDMEVEERGNVLFMG